MSTTNNKESPPNQTQVDWQWLGIVRMIARMENIQKQEYVQQCAQREANREAAIAPTKEQLKLMLDGISDINRERLEGALDAFESVKLFAAQGH